MKAFTKLTASFLPLDRSNVDTDAIIPQQYLKSVKRTGFGVNLFDKFCLKSKTVSRRQDIDCKR